MPIVLKKSATDPKLRWFRESRFGMFIHFGLYALLERGEWVQYVEDIPKRTYEPLMDRFNPSKFDAEAWVDLAERAGCRYITFTAKHHDGFCLFDSSLTDYKITNTPFGRDLTRELIEACHRRRMRICLYYSQPDWHHPNFVHFPGAFKDLDHPPSDQRPDWPAYLQYCHGQVEELCTRYGRIDGIWFDGSHKSEKMWQGRKLYRLVKKHQPGAAVNDRARYGDFFTPERKLPEDLTGYTFEACQSISKEGWGWHKDSPQFGVQNLVENLARVVSEGGNFLLNVGPLPDGTVPERQVDRMKAVGHWLNVNGAAIYATEAGRVETGSTDVLTTRRRNTVYVFLSRWPDSDRLVIPGLFVDPSSAMLLSGQTSLKTVCTRSGLEIHGLPMSPPDPVLNVLRLRFTRAPKIVGKSRPEDRAETIHLSEKGFTRLPVQDARAEGRGVKGGRLKITQEGPETAVTNWFAPEQRLTWSVDAPEAGDYRLRIRLACPKPHDGATFVVKGRIGSASGTVEATRSYEDYRWLDVGSIRLPKGGSRLSLSPKEMAYGYLFAHTAALELIPGNEPLDRRSAETSRPGAPAV